MKKKIILGVMVISGCFLANFSLAQSGVQIMKQKYVVTYEPTSVLEAGIDNIIRITAGDPSVKRILVNASQGTVKQKGENFIVHPASKGKIVLKIYNNNDPGNPVFMEEKKMDVASGSFATFGGKQGGNISIEELKQLTKVELSGGEEAMEITEFKLSVAGQDITYKEFNAKGESLSDEMLEQLRQLPAGAKIYIEYIRAGTGIVTRSIAPLSFTVTD